LSTKHCIANFFFAQDNAAKIENAKNCLNAELRSLNNWS